MKIKIIVVSVLGLILLSCSTKKTSLTQPLEDEITGVANPVISLNGKWKFNLSPPQEFWANDTNLVGWSEIEVPGECLIQGFRIEHNIGYPYKRQVEIPADFKDKKIFLRFDGVYSYARVWVNGRYIRDHHGGFTTWYAEITDQVEPGRKAGFTVEVTDWDDDISYGSGYAHHLIGGILRDVWLLALPKDHLSRLHVQTDFDTAYRNAILMIQAGVSFENGKNAEIAFSLQDKDRKSIRVEPAKLKLAKSTPEGEIRIPIKEPLPWDAEHPISTC